VRKTRLAEARVLDSWALLCYLEQEPGFEKVVDLLEEASASSQPLYMCVVNWGEVWYQVMRRLGEERAIEIERIISTLPIEIVEADLSLTREAARLKARKRMAYADCFAAALALLKNAKLYTGDPEFRVVERDVRVVWL